MDLRTMDTHIDVAEFSGMIPTVFPCLQEEGKAQFVRVKATVPFLVHSCVDPVTGAEHRFGAELITEQGWLLIRFFQFASLPFTSIPGNSVHWNDHNES